MDYKKEIKRLQERVEYLEGQAIDMGGGGLLFRAKQTDGLNLEKGDIVKIKDKELVGIISKFEVDYKVDYAGYEAYALLKFGENEEEYVNVKNLEKIGSIYEHR